MDKTQQDLRQHNKDDNNIMLTITAEELKSRLERNEPLMVFDIGSSQRYDPRLCSMQ